MARVLHVEAVTPGPDEVVLVGRVGLICRRKGHERSSGSGTASRIFHGPHTQERGLGPDTKGGPFRIKIRPDRCAGEQAHPSNYEGSKDFAFPVLIQMS